MSETNKQHNNSQKSSESIEWKVWKKQTEPIAIKIFLQSTTFCPWPGCCNNWKLVKLMTAVWVNFGQLRLVWLFQLKHPHSPQWSFENRNRFKTQTLVSYQNGLLTLKRIFIPHRSSCIELHAFIHILSTPFSCLWSSWLKSTWVTRYNSNHHNVLNISKWVCQKIKPKNHPRYNNLNLERVGYQTECNYGEQKDTDIWLHVIEMKDVLNKSIFAHQTCSGGEGEQHFEIKLNHSGCILKTENITSDQRYHHSAHQMCSGGEG